MEIRSNFIQNTLFTENLSNIRLQYKTLRIRPFSIKLLIISIFMLFFISIRSFFLLFVFSYI